jgi:DNA-directed RNA polymerase specialized sigma24 family protein
MNEDLCELVRIARSMRTPVRQAFTLCKVYGLGPAQIAVEMGIPENMVTDYLVEAVLHVASSTGIATTCDGRSCTDSADDHVGA